jgi:hypothetical protein
VIPIYPHIVDPNHAAQSVLRLAFVVGVSGVSVPLGIIISEFAKKVQR